MSQEPLNKLQQIYIGQSQNPVQRLEQHDRTRDWWTKAIVFVYEDYDEMFDRSIIQYLEYLLIKTVMECNMCQLMENCQVPKEPVIRKADKVFAFEVFEYIRMLLSFSGHHFCQKRVYDLSREPIKSRKRTIIQRLASEMNRHIDIEDNYEDCNDESFTYSYTAPDNSCYATVIPVNDKFMLLFGRLSHKVDIDSLSEETQEKIDTQTRQLKRDIMCDSLNEAAFIITGDNKPIDWKIYRNNN